jgi:glycosyltransferase involved in cell wall biosynthesis
MTPTLEWIINQFNIEFSHWSDYLFVVLLLLTAIAFCFQLYYYLFVYARLLSYQKNHQKTELEPVSVIICARNESDNLRVNLPLVLNQFYPDFQVVVVDDGSEDNTQEILGALQQQYKNLYFTHIEHTHPYPHSKKLAQTVGIKAATHEQLLFIDADCKPVSPNWIRQMQRNFLFKTDIILGYGGYETHKGLLNRIIRTDTVHIAMQYLSYAIKGKAYMGVGRNLGYRRTLFFDHKGFSSHLHLQSGDDDLFVNEVSRPDNTAIEIHPDSFTRSEPESTLKHWLRQKRRHLTTGYHYKKRDRNRIATEVITRQFFYVVAVLLLAMGQLTGYAATILLVRLCIHLVIFKKIMNRFNEKKLLLLSIIYDMFILPLTGILMIANRIKKPTKYAWR